MREPTLKTLFLPGLFTASIMPFGNMHSKNFSIHKKARAAT